MFCCEILKSLFMSLLICDVLQMLQGIEMDVVAQELFVHGLKNG